MSRRPAPLFSAPSLPCPAVALTARPAYDSGCMTLTGSIDTIVAVATPPGQGGVAIVRLSGPESRAVLRRLFRPTRPDFKDFRPSTLHHGHVLDAAGVILDEVLAVFMPGPGSFTGEDTAEIHCHGGLALPGAVLAECCRQGARPARRGEFSYRAWRNGRLDLTQAEAVAEAIAAPTRAAAQLAQVKLSGVLGRRVAALRAELEELKAQLCLAVDFPEEDVDCLPPDRLAEVVERGLAALDALLAGVERTRAWREGALAVLRGRVNAGKSSLLNALAGRERAIVTDIPGTTRDWLEELLDLDGLPVRLVDTAGLRRTESPVERAGLERAGELAREADLVLFVVGGDAPLSDEERQAADELSAERTLVVVNKDDLPRVEPWPGTELADRFEVAAVSARTGVGLEALAARLRERLAASTPEPEPDTVAPNLRQAEALRRARAELAELAVDAAGGLPYDLLGVRLDAACAILAEITGEIAAQDVLEAIFNRFCIGK